MCVLPTLQVGGSPPDPEYESYESNQSFSDDEEGDEAKEDEKESPMNGVPLPYAVSVLAAKTWITALLNHILAFERAEEDLGQHGSLEYDLYKVKHIIEMMVGKMQMGHAPLY